MKATLLAIVLGTSLVLAGCTATQSTTAPAGSVDSAGQDKPNAAEQKVGDTVITGAISQVGEKYFITVPGQTPKEIESYLVQLPDYVGKTVTITGQYSGDTLFVGKVE